MKPNKCSKCGGNVCVCADEIMGLIKWAAHCMDCDNGFPVDYIHDSEPQAIIIWNKSNKQLDNNTK